MSSVGCTMFSESSGQQMSAKSVQQGLYAGMASRRLQRLGHVRNIMSQIDADAVEEDYML